MYNGYRLKIDGQIFPNSLIAKGSFSATPGRRVAEIWTDAVLVEHEVATDDPKESISFSIVPHGSDAHGDIVAYFDGDLSHLEVEFFDDLTNDYRTGDFRLGSINFPHLATPGGSIEYDAAPVELIEN